MQVKTVRSIGTVCEVCFRRTPMRRPNQMGYVVFDGPDDWSLYHSRVRIGRADAAQYGSGWGRLKAPNMVMSSRRPGPLRLECPNGHRLNPKDMHPRIVDAITRSLSYIEIPEN